MFIYLLTVTIGSLHMLTTRITAYTCISSSRLWEVLFARGGVVWRPYFLSFLIDWKTEPSFYKHEAFCKNLEGQPCLPPQIPHYIAKSKQYGTDRDLTRFGTCNSAINCVSEGVKWGEIQNKNETFKNSTHTQTP